MNTWIRYSLTTVVMATALSAGVLTHRACTAAPTSSPQAQAVSSFLAMKLPDAAGTPRSINEWQGKIRVINFWATWCPPCREEMPLFIKAQSEWSKQGVQFVGVAIDNTEAVNAFSRKLGVNYPLLLAEEQGPPLMAGLGNALGALPYTMIVDGKGKVLRQHAGEVKAADLAAWLRAATGKK